MNIKIAVLLTSFNRLGNTLASIKAVFEQKISSNCDIDVFLTDDASTDGTADAVQGEFPSVRVICGNGSLFWNGGMRLAFAEAVKGDYDFYFWLNDDTVLGLKALRTLLITHSWVLEKTGKEAIIVGTTCSARGDIPTYGGRVRHSRLFRTRFSLKMPTSKPTECETMNGNCVLVPRAVAAKVGNLDSNFVHSMGDFDYGLRARHAGFSVWIMPGYAGTCEKNSHVGSYNDKSLPFGLRFQQVQSPKGLPVKEWRIFCRRHAGIFWWLFYALPYVRLIISGVFRRRALGFRLPRL